MDLNTLLLEKLKSYGVGHRGFDDPLFVNDKPPARLGIYDFDDESLCHEVLKTRCNILGCTYVSESVMQYENHYNASHMYKCRKCKLVLPSPHLLDLHLQESHDSFFAVMAAKKPSYCCYIEECKEKFLNAEKRFDHCVKVHKVPKDFRFESQKSKIHKKKNKTYKEGEEAMEQDDSSSSKRVEKNHLVLTTSRTRVFPKYTGRKFTSRNESRNPVDVNMEEIMTDLKESLPE